MTSPSRRTAWPKSTLCALIALLVGWTVAVGAPTAGAQTSDSLRASIIQMVLTSRVSAGQSAPLADDPQLADEAQRWAQSLADLDVLQHSPSLARLLEMGFDRAGENVGRGGLAFETMLDSFEASPSHHLNLHDPGWTSMGVGAVARGDQLFVVMLFGQRAAPAHQVAPKRLPSVVRRVEVPASASSALRRRSSRTVTR